MDESTIFFGDEVKALGGGKVGGLLVRFGSPTDYDLTNEYFSPETNLFLEDGQGSVPVIYDHALDSTLKARQLGRAKLKITDAGVWAEAQLALRDDFEKKIYAMVKAGKLSWSSGSAPHMVERETVGKAVHLTSWICVEASLTPTPCEPRNTAISLKSYAASERIDLFKAEPEPEPAPVNTDAALLDAMPLLRAVISPLDLKGFDARSEAVAAALEEYSKHGRLILDVVKGQMLRLEELDKFRKEKDGRGTAKSKRDWVEATHDRLSRQIEEVKSVVDALEEMMRRYQKTDAQLEAVNEQASFILRKYKAD